MKIAYFDCFAGAGGDMIVASMLDAGLDEKFLTEQLDSLGISDLKIQISSTTRCGLSALSFAPSAPQQHKHRNLSDITEIITQSKISRSAKERAIEIFKNIARAEGAVHGTEPGQIHFHEVGAVDSIVDIVSACIGIEALGIEKVYCSRLSVGAGTVKCSHGLMPVPAPATAELLKESKVPVVGGPGNSELLTPTAAAILTGFVDEFGPLPSVTIEAIGYGAGTLESDEFPNLLRLIIGKCGDSIAQTDWVCLLESNMDDITGEVIGFVMEKLLDEGALDVFTTPIQMKHNRPACKLSVICRISDIELMEKILFEEGLTLGIRKQIYQRSKLPRDFVTVNTEFGKIRVKTALLNGKIVNVKPEYSDCAKAAKHHNVGVKTVQKAAIKAYDIENPE